MLAGELREQYGLTDRNDISVIAYTPHQKDWWHVHDDEEVPEDWAFKLKNLPFCLVRGRNETIISCIRIQ